MSERKEINDFKRRIKEVDPTKHDVLKKQELELIYWAIYRYSTRDDLTLEESSLLLDMLFDLYKLIEPLLDERKD